MNHRFFLACRAGVVRTFHLRLLRRIAVALAGSPTRHPRWGGLAEAVRSARHGRPEGLHYGLVTLGLAVVIVALAAVPVAGQTPTAAKTTAAPKTAKTWTPPRTAWGDPDLQGLWPSTNVAGTPFERPEQFAGRTLLTDEEFAARARDFAAAEERVKKGIEVGAELPPPANGDSGGGPPHWGEGWLRKPTRLTSLVAEPADGKIPPMTPDGQRRAATQWHDSFGSGPWNAPEDLGPYDRCISRGVLGSMFPSAYNNGNQIVQGPGYVAIRNEMIHEARIIPVDGRPHLPNTMRSYMGDPRGHWEGDTLVVETTNLNGKVGARGNGNNFPMSEALRLVERFTRFDADTLQYEITIDDPKTWTRPWKVAYPLKQDPAYGMFEYACHEGNYGLRNILAGARATDEVAEAAAKNR